MSEDNICIWKGCNNKQMKGRAICEKHFEEMKPYFSCRDVLSDEVIIDVMKIE